MDDESDKPLFQKGDPYPTPHECCGEVMSYQWSDEGDDGYPCEEDGWLCLSCGETRPSRRYRDWFGKGDTDHDLKEYLESIEETPLFIFHDAYMVCLVFPTHVVVFGYDGNEYCHSFRFDTPHSQIATKVLGLRLDRV